MMIEMGLGVCWLGRCWLNLACVGYSWLGVLWLGFGILAGEVSGESLGWDRWSEGYYGELRLESVEGEEIRWREHRGLVLVFITEDCPIANAYQPEIARLAGTHGGEGGFRFVLVHANPGVSRERVEQHRQEYGVRCDVVMDPDQAIAKRMGVRVSPEVFVVDGKGTLTYDGRIDDQYVAFGKKRAAPTERNLEGVLGAMERGEAIGVRETEAVGCRIRIRQVP